MNSVIRNELRQDQGTLEKMVILLVTGLFPPILLFGFFVMRQQAIALIDARKTIVEGAVEIVRDPVDRLEKAELHMTHEERERLIRNLLVVICSGERAQPVLQVNSQAHEKR